MLGRLRAEPGGRDLRVVFSGEVYLLRKSVAGSWFDRVQGVPFHFLKIYWVIESGRNVLPFLYISVTRLGII